ncbi:uncharacterized protein LOC110668443 [Hevea brasiliensis]|uniref:uncharacterized protein LOC110668443 n=1 Tax=Hevea brasiliensis TaxID=3981 RepID=UPI0025EC97DF|nr:uncharacterized protein LOC110668443 [Hevea brasiliensis]
MEGSSKREVTEEGVGLISYVNPCFLFEALLKCLGIENKTQESSACPNSQQKDHEGDGKFDCEGSSRESSSTTEMDACPPSTTDPSTTTDDPVLAGAPPRPSVSTGNGPRTN